MGRKVLPITVDLLAETTAPCRACLFWELDPVSRVDASGEDAATRKGRWLESMVEQWGSVGRTLLVEDRPVGHVIYGPSSLFPGGAGFPTAPISADALQMTAIWVEPSLRGAGYGRLLIQAMVRDVLTRGTYKAIEAFGDRGAISAVHGSRCAPPAAFLSRVGFKVHRAHPSAPRMRIDLDAVLTWRDIGGAVERLIGSVRPQKVPMPQHREVSGHRVA